MPEPAIEEIALTNYRSIEDRVRAVAELAYNLWQAFRERE